MAKRSKSVARNNLAPSKQGRSGGALPKIAVLNGLGGRAGLSASSVATSIELDLTEARTQHMSLDDLELEFARDEDVVGPLPVEESKEKRMATAIIRVRKPVAKRPRRRRR
jgi:hypothetical protein